MFAAAQGSIEDLQSKMLIMLVIITVAVIFWRTMIKLLIIGGILLAAVGLFEVLASLHQ